VAQSFLAANKRVCKAIERYLPQRRVNIQARYDETVAAYMNSLPAGAVVADIGSGKECRFARYRSSAAQIRIVGVDISEEELAENRDVDEKRVADVARGLPFGRGELDLIASRSVLEHLDDTEAFIADSRRVLGPGGYSIHLFASKFAPFALLNSILPPRVSRLLLDRLHPESKGTVGFRTHYDRTYPSGVAALLKKHGFEVVASEVSYYQSGYYNFFIPIYLLSAVYELLLYGIRAENLAAKAMVVARRL
jgi:ubiquinone/menaquinone biosynthesis C-methylase UbiE